VAVWVTMIFGLSVAAALLNTRYLILSNRRVAAGSL
jgi:hypothetical protein